MAKFTEPSANTPFVAKQVTKKRAMMVNLERRGEYRANQKTPKKLDFPLDFINGVGIPGVLHGFHYADKLSM